MHFTEETGKGLPSRGLSTSGNCKLSRGTYCYPVVPLSSGWTENKGSETDVGDKILSPEEEEKIYSGKILSQTSVSDPPFSVHPDDST
jgi:hypothetical protein